MPARARVVIGSRAGALGCGAVVVAGADDAEGAMVGTIPGSTGGATRVEGDDGAGGERGGDGGAGAVEGRRVAARGAGMMTMSIPVCTCGVEGGGGVAAASRNGN